MFYSAPGLGHVNNFELRKWYISPRSQTQKKRRKKGGFWTLVLSFLKGGNIEDA